MNPHSDSPAPPDRPGPSHGDAPFSSAEFLASGRALAFWLENAAMMSGDAAIREDSVSRTAAIMARVVENEEHTFESEANFCAFSWVVLRFELLGEIRDRRRYETAIAALMARMRSGNGEGESEFSESDLKAVREAVRCLPAQERRVIKLRFVHGKTLDEVAAETDRSSSTVNRTEKRAFKMLAWVLKTRHGFEIPPHVETQSFKIAEDDSADVSSRDADGPFDLDP
jgi:RNA polymerase sigma factor (sigma-70 family)